MFKLSAILVALGATRVLGRSQSVEIHSGHRNLVELATLPVQTFYIPLAEDDVFFGIFKNVNERKAEAPIEAMIAISISTDDTVIWWDHWEDGYDADVLNMTAASTEIWGDGQKSNGCHPDVTDCTDENDVLKAGDNIVIQNTIPIPRTTEIKYDGRDKVQASYPITITRGSYPKEPGSLMAGGIEVHDTNSWGKNYEAPIGQNIGQHFQAFQFSALFFMAEFPGTKVTYPDGSSITLNEGESGWVQVNRTDQVKANKRIQVDFITGDVMSYYELRWFTLLPTEDWTNDYLTPVGDSVAYTRCLLYNPSRNKITVNMEYLTHGKYVKNYEVTINGQKSLFSKTVPTGSGARFTGSGNFLALSITDTRYKTNTNQVTAGQWYDWGFPVMPTNQLTDQVLIGWGYGCTDNQCYGKGDRSMVWVTPIEDADIYIDYTNSGVNPTKFEAKRLTSNKYVDEDNDMSGAVIYAVKPGTGEPGTGVNGDPVDIAAAWGQDPSVSKFYQSISLDLGTVVVPFPVVRVRKIADKTEVRHGETLTYTIKLMNNGQSDLPGASLKVFDTLDAGVTYVPGSTTYSYSSESGDSILTKDVADKSGGSFPLKGGHTVDISLPRRGGTVDIIFDVVVDGPMVMNKVINRGYVKQPFGSALGFYLATPLDFEPEVSIDNTVYHGDDMGASCETDIPVESVEVVAGSIVTYCFNVTNVGNTYLTSVSIDNQDLSFADTTSIGLLPPGESIIVPYTTTATADLLNSAKVTADPAYENGQPIPYKANVQDTDPSQVTVVQPAPSVSINNLVYLSSDGDDLCETDTPTESVSSFMDDAVIYCLNVTNTGNTDLDSITIVDPELGPIIDTSAIGQLAPGESAMIAVPGTISSTEDNTATVTANPVHDDGTDMENLQDVSHSDPSGVVLVEYSPSISVDNRVGSMDGSCDDATDDITGHFGDEVKYCFTITNTGDTALTNINLSDPLINYEEIKDAVLLAGESMVVTVNKTITGDLINTLTVTGSPILETGVQLPYDPVTADDDSETKEIPFEAEVTIDNTVYIGNDGGDQCGTSAAVESVFAQDGIAVTYCFLVTNGGETRLEDIVVVNDDLDYTTSIDALAPGESQMIFVDSTILGDLNNTAVVTANPVLDDGTDIATLADVTDSDPSGVLEDKSLLAGITVSNTVYKGEDLGAACPGEESVTGLLTTPVIYCFDVTNSGETHLRVTEVINNDLGFQDNRVVVLAPGESTMVVQATLITGTLDNTVTVTATPVTEDDVPLTDYQDVSASDPSGVIDPNDGTVRSSEKEPFKPPNDDPNVENSCLLNAYNEDVSSDAELVCTSTEVAIDSITAEETQSCILGEMITLTVDASIHIGPTSLFDLGWYVATDGGNALEGTCVVNGLQNGNTYDVVSYPGSTDIVGTVSWDSDAAGGNDACGDITSDTSGNIDTPLMVELTIPCADENEDGALDVSVCFSWRTEAGDGVCTLSRDDPATVNTLADVYPAQPQQDDADCKQHEADCFCQRYDIKNVDVTSTLSDSVAPC